MSTIDRISVALSVIVLVCVVLSCYSRNTGCDSEGIAVPQESVALRVLYIEGYPNWNYRALTNIMLSDSSIEFQTYLLNAADGFVQKSSAGLPPLSDMPITTESILKYDVLILGDIPLSSVGYAEALGYCLGDFVEHHGGGLVTIAGTHYSMLPASIKHYLPVHIGDAVLRTVEDGFSIHLTDAGTVSSIMRGGNWTERSRTFYSYLDRILAKPSSRILAVYRREEFSGSDVPVVVTADVGKGRSLFFGFDELWRLDPEAFRRIWTQVLRHGAAGRRK